MKPASVKEIKQELLQLEQEELMNICLRLSKFKKENKELLTYLLFESSDEAGYISLVKEEIDDSFEAMNRSRYFLMKKTVRKIQRLIRKHARFSPHKETEIELSLYFCECLKALRPSISRSKVLSGILDRELLAVERKLKALHPDLQYDYGQQIIALRST